MGYLADARFTHNYNCYNVILIGAYFKGSPTISFQI